MSIRPESAVATDHASQTGANGPEVCIPAIIQR